MAKTQPTQTVDYPFVARWFFLRGANRFRKRLLLLLVLTVLAALSDGISLWLIVPILQSLLPVADSAAGLSQPDAALGLAARMADSVPDDLQFLFGPDVLIITLLALMLLLVTAKTALNLVTNWMSASCQWGLLSAWTKRLLGVYLKQDYLAFLKNKHGTMLGNITIETRIAAIGVRDGITFVSQLILAGVYVSVLFVTNWQITLFQMAAILVLSVVTWGFTHRLTSRISREILRSKQQVEARASESLAALRQIRASAIERDTVTKFGKPVDEMAQLMIRQQAYNAMPKPVSELLVLLLVIATVYYFHAFTDLPIAAQVPTLTLLILIANRLFIALAKLATAYMSFTASLPGMELIAGLLDEKPHEAPASGIRAPADLTHDIVFADVSLKYPGKPDYVLDGLNLTIAGQKVTALVGPSGGGKSTIIDLLLGFIRPDAGVIYLDGHDSRQLDQELIRRRIGYVSQDVFLFNASIRENLLIHKHDATQAEIDEACRKAHIAGLIRKLPDGYDTLVGDRGVMLSGGERQRMAIAIALLRDPDLIIFDEATNALDPEAEAAVHQAIRELADKTVFVVTHRLTAALQPDHVFELADGRATEITNIGIASDG